MSNEEKVDNTFIHVGFKTFYDLIITNNYSITNW